MTNKPQIDDLPLGVFTPKDWAKLALEDSIRLLNDHAHLEKKAATNSLDLVHRWPAVSPPKRWIATLCGVARDEVVHLAQVVRILEARGGEMTKGHRSSYAAALHGLIRKGEGPKELVDRLLVTAIIEARSCERFMLLTGAESDEVLAKLYRRLYASEHGHHRVFVALAESVADQGTLAEADIDVADRIRSVKKRFKELCEAEAGIIKQQPAVAGFLHGWV